MGSERPLLPLGMAQWYSVLGTVLLFALSGCRRDKLSTSSDDDDDDAERASEGIAMYRMQVKLASDEAAFLGSAARMMRQRHEETGRYPASWELVVPEGLYFSGTKWWRGGPLKGRPAPRQGASWKPVPDRWRFSSHTYTIVHADTQSFQIDGVDDWGRTTWTVTDKDEDEVQLLPMYCTWERVPEEDEPCAFLRKAAHYVKMMIGYKKPYMGGYKGVPETWPEVRIMHWSNVDHFRSDDSAGRPPADATNLWRPRGSHYTYELISYGSTDTGSSGAIRSYNEAGLKNYFVLIPDKDGPTEVP